MDKYYFFKSYHTALKDLKASTRYAIREAIDEYMFENREPDFKDNLSKSIWSLLLPTLHKSKVRFEAGKQTFSKTQAKVEQNPSKIGAKQEQSSNLLPVCSSKEKGERKKEINNKPPISPNGGSHDVGFKLFWEEYPKKVGKIAARKAFDKAIKIVPVEDMIIAIDRQKHWEQWRKDNGAYIPNPATWLNQGRWDDKQTDAEEPARKEKPVPEFTVCPDCGSYDLGKSLDRVKCRDCGHMFDYSHAKGRWERAE